MLTQEITQYSALVDLLRSQKKVSNLAVQDMDLRGLEHELCTTIVEDCLFLGCTFTDRSLCFLQKKNYIFPELNLPYRVYPNKLYEAEDLYAGFKSEVPQSYANTLDKKIYDHFIATGKYTTDVKESLARSLHDQSITNALQDFIETYHEIDIIAIMGGHNLSRQHPNYTQIVHLSKTLTESGKLMVSGGGPGAMEATHLGAWMAGRSADEVEAAIALLQQAPSYKDQLWLATAFQVIHTYPRNSFHSLGIPTWLYGHEPPTPFASRMAKYFTNSLREDGLLAIAKGGVIFTPGSAGTVQEVFQEVTQNHYLTLNYASPMIFFDQKFWTQDWPIYPLLRNLADATKLNHLNLGLYDQNEDIIHHLESFKSSKQP